MIDVHELTAQSGPGSDGCGSALGWITGKTTTAPGYQRLFDNTTRARRGQPAAVRAEREDWKRQHKVGHLCECPVAKETDIPVMCLDETVDERDRLHVTPWTSRAESFIRPPLVQEERDRDENHACCRTHDICTDSDACTLTLFDPRAVNRMPYEECT